MLSTAFRRRTAGCGCFRWHAAGGGTVAADASSARAPSTRAATPNGCPMGGLLSHWQFLLIPFLTLGFMSTSTRNIVAWVLQVVLGLGFIASGIIKISAMSATVNNFTALGLPSGLAYVVAGAEVLGGIGLLIPRFTRLAALGLVLIMIGAVVMHATKIPGGIAKGVPAIVFLALLLGVLWLRQPRPAKA